MKQFAFIVLFLICGSISNAEYAEYAAFKIMPASLLNSDGNKVEVSNLPNTRSQDGLPICYGVAALSAYNQAVCKMEKSDCKNLDPEKTPSILRAAILGADHDYVIKNGSGVIPYSTGGGGYKALNGLTDARSQITESCFPLDQFVQKYGSNDKAMYRVFENLRKNYFDKNKSEGSICMECLLGTIQNDLNLKIDQVEATKALNENIFDKFLYDIIIKSCTSRVKVPDMTAESWPDSKNKMNYDLFIKKSVQLLKGNTPIVSGLCLDQKLSLDQCKSGHTVLITGYKKTCTANKSSCVDYIKIQNTWGQDWQNQNSDGWIDARNYYEYMDHDKDSLAWVK